MGVEGSDEREGGEWGGGLARLEGLLPVPCRRAVARTFFHGYRKEPIWLASAT